ncbi:MAG: phage terminase large subunit [Gloeotrichia echinulata GP01]
MSYTELQLRAQAELTLRRRRSPTVLTLADFVKESWQVIEPSTELLWNWHIDAMCWHIQETLLDWHKHKLDPSYEQRIQNLLLNVPPGSLKSRCLSVCTPAWMWTICPSWRAIFLSANPRIALRDSVYCRDVIESDWYQKRFSPDWKLRIDNNSKSSFWNTKGGVRSAFGFNSRITGDRGDCLDGSTIVEAEYGQMTIKEIFDRAAPIKVWTLNHQTGEVELARVVAARKVLAKNSIKIITGEGIEIKCTHDHRFYTNQGYVTASSLKPGDTLRVWKPEKESFKALPELLVRVKTQDGNSLMRSLCGLQQARRNDYYKEWTSQVNSSDSPYQQGQGEQQFREFNYPVQQMSQITPQLEEVTISRVEFDCDISNYVYDIQVEGNSNFFANKILVHNCLLWDDPHDAQEVNSELIRQGVIDRWDSAIRNRVNDLRSSVRIGIMQRLNELDLSGHVLKQGGWEHLCIPQEFETQLKPTALGWVDPRTEPGELMFPERFSREVLEQEKKALGSYGYAGQHQQRPAPADGGHFKRSWWKYYKIAPDDFDMVIQSWDCTFKDSKKSDFVVGQVWGKRGGQFYLLDQVRDRMDFPTTIAAIRALSAKYPNSTAKLVEDKANGPAVISSLEREIPGIIAIEPEGGKLVRAVAIAPFVEAGNVFLPDPSIASWVGDFVAEFSIFPNGSNDDMVDSASQSLNWLVSKITYWAVSHDNSWGS